MAKRITHTCPNCKHEHIDYLTALPTWWCESPRRKGRGEVGYSPMERCRYFEPSDEAVRRDG